MLPVSRALLIGAIGAFGARPVHAQETIVYVTGNVQPSLLTICPCADPFVLGDNSLNEDLFLDGENLQPFDEAPVEIVGERVDCGDCIKIAVRHIAFLPPDYRYSDLNGDQTSNAVDVVIGINYLFGSGPYPASGWRSIDLDADGQTNLGDLVRLVHLVYGRAPQVSGGVLASAPGGFDPYAGCPFWIVKNTMPLVTGEVDENGRFAVRLPADRYAVQFFPPYSSLPGEIDFDLTHGDVTLPWLSLPVEFCDSVLLVTLREGVSLARLEEIMSYLGGEVRESRTDGSAVQYVAALPVGFHFARAAAILLRFSEITAAEPVPLVR